MHSTKKRSKFYILVFLVLILSILIFIISLFFRSSIILDKKEIPITLSIGNESGFNITKDTISFGALSKGNSATREDISVINNYDFPIVLEISVEGKAKDFVIYENMVYLEPKESKSLSFSTIIITNESYGDYFGKAVIMFKRVVSE